VVDGKAALLRNLIIEASQMIQGTVDAKFLKVKAAFESCFADGLELGGAVSVFIDGKPVVDLWGGHANKAKTKTWQQDTLANVWSSTKGVMAICVAMLVQRGKLSYDAPIAKYWPEFAANGKDKISLDLVMSHQAGLEGVPHSISDEQLYAWTPYVNALAAMAPWWQPGTRCVYHALTYGHLTGEPLRRVDGRGVGQFIREEISAPLGLNFYVGVPENIDARVCELIEGPHASDWVENVLRTPYPHSCMNPRPLATAPNTRAWRKAEVPGGNGHSDARSLAKLYGALVAKQPHLLAPAILQEATRCRYEGLDSSFESETAFGAGFRIKDGDYPIASANGAFGHAGWGGTLAFGDPTARLGFSYVTSHMMGFDGVDPRRQRLIEAVYGAL
jgi:CubicO group peptidase (beta-lactamase class C family)